MSEFVGFTQHIISVSDSVSIYALKSGTGPPIVALHGHRENHLIWSDVAPGLVEHGFTVILLDLRGCGQSSKPHGDPEHETYSKRTMANDVIVLMNHFGFSKFNVLAHDRGARVAHRMALDHPESVLRLMLIDIVPTLKQYACSNGSAFGSIYFHWYLLIQKEPIPENFINSAPANYLAARLPISPNQVLDAPMTIAHPGFKASHLMSYLRMFHDPAAVHAACEDYRASQPGGLDLTRDAEDLAQGIKVKCPLHVIWGGKGIIGKLFSPISDWKEVCEGEVTGQEIPDSGHFVCDQAPEQVLAHAKTFFQAE